MSLSLFNICSKPECQAMLTVLHKLSKFTGNKLYLDVSIRSVRIIALFSINTLQLKKTQPVRSENSKN